METKTVHQPLHAAIRARLDPEYVETHDSILQYVPCIENAPWDPISRLQSSPTAHCSIKEVDVGSARDINVGNTQLRVFTPHGAPPTGGWPVLVWLHGGGWVMGGLNSENGFLRHVCKYVGCVVITVNYRHAPEHKYPTAIEDAYAGLRWIMLNANASALELNISRLALGGLSAGGGLTAVLAMKAAVAADLPTQPVFQLLICPVIDNTATEATVWSDTRFSPWLTPSRMKWYRDKYFADPKDTSKWQASPCFADPILLAKSPKTFISIAECDLLAKEAHLYGESLKRCSVKTTVNEYKGSTHSVLILAGAHAIGKQLVHDACTALATALQLNYQPGTSIIERAGL